MLSTIQFKCFAKYWLNFDTCYYIEAHFVEADIETSRSCEKGNRSWSGCHRLIFTLKNYLKDDAVMVGRPVQPYKASAR